VPKNIKAILDSTYSIRQEMTQPDVPSRIIPLIEDLINNSLDDVCGLQLRWAFVRAVDMLYSEGIAFTIGAIDFRNLSGLNSYFEHSSPGSGAHEQANKVLREIAEEAITYYARKHSGEAYRIGGDEFSVIFPEMSADEAKLIMESMQKKADEIVKKHGLENEPHPKHDYLPTGAGGIDYGCADTAHFSNREAILNGADNHLFLLKRRFLQETVSRQPNPELWIWDKQNKHYYREKT
jgi:GGDEF domain-containing protein